MDDFTDRIRPYLRIKALTIVLVMLLTTLKVYFNVVEPAAYVTGILASLFSALTMVWLWLAASRRQVAPAFVHAMLVTDLLAIMIGLYFYGGPQTTWGFLPVVVIVMASFLFDLRTTIVYGLLTCAMLLAVYGVDYLNLLPHQPAFVFSYPYWRNGGYLLDLLSGLFLLFTLVTAASAYFNHLARAATRRIKKTVEDLAVARTELEQRIQESTELFDNSPVSLWEEDIGELNEHLSALRRSGVNDFAGYFGQHPEELTKCSALIKVVKVNKATLALYKARDLGELTQGLSRVFVEESYQAFGRELVALADGKTAFESEAITRTLAGDKLEILLKLALLPDRRRVLISIIDLTDRKKIENDLQQRMKESQAFSDAAVGRELKMAELEKEVARLKGLVNR